MKWRSARLSLSTLLLSVLTLASLATPVSAATAKQGGNGLRVSPVRSDLTIKPGETQNLTINVTNVTAAPATFQTIVNDFMANPNESGSPAIILNPNEFSQSHSLKRFVAPVADFSLAPGQQKAIVVKIAVPTNAAGGGYFGAIRFAPAGSNTGPNQTVSLAGSVGSLVLLKVPGNISEKVSIASFDARINDRPSSFFTTNKDIDAVVRFQNQGNIQEEPFGKILLKNRSGKILGQYEVNNTNPPGNVLPDSIRKFPVSLQNKVGKFGQYKLEGNFGYGSSGQLLSASTTFYVIPTSVIVGFVLLVLLIIFIVLVLPRLVRAYNRRVVSRAGRASNRR
jgi:hypothetical protein